MAKIMSMYSYREGAREIVKYLKAKGYRAALVSGSIDMVVEKVAGELGIEMWRAHNKLKFDEKGRFVRIDCSGDDADFKLDAVAEFCRDLAINIQQVVCVGDGFNDRKIFEQSGRGVTFAGSQVEKLAWKVVKKLGDLKEIL
jgi:phosphoserine phosphatase